MVMHRRRHIIYAPSPSLEELGIVEVDSIKWCLPNVAVKQLRLIDFVPRNATFVTDYRAGTSSLHYMVPVVLTGYVCQTPSKILHIKPQG
jgi:hypothetical protein